jgi:hypothetical protein
LWLTRREDTKWLRSVLMGAFVASLAIFLPTPYFLAPHMLLSHWISSTLVRVAPSIFIFLCLLVYWATLTRREFLEDLEGDKDIIAADVVRPLTRTVLVGGVLGVMFVAVLTAAYATYPKRMLKLPKNWTVQERREHMQDVLKCRDLPIAIKDEVSRVLAYLNKPELDRKKHDLMTPANAGPPK